MSKHLLNGPKVAQLRYNEEQDTVIVHPHGGELWIRHRLGSTPVVKVAISANGELVVRVYDVENGERIYTAGFGRAATP